jgi:hypothetical protein
LIFRPSLSWYSSTELATASERIALPGEPPVSVRSPLLPADMTGRTPFAAISSTTAFSGSSTTP